MKNIHIYINQYQSKVYQIMQVFSDLNKKFKEYKNRIQKCKKNKKYMRKSKKYTKEIRL